VRTPELRDLLASTNLSKQEIQPSHRTEYTIGQHLRGGVSTVRSDNIQEHCGPYPSTTSELSLLLLQDFSMTMRLSSAFLAAASAIALYYLVNFWRLKRKAIALGCKPVPVWRAWDLLGINMTLATTTAMSGNRLSEGIHSLLEEVQEREGRECTTIQWYLPPGLMHFFTTDPRNLQAILATQFKDFQIPSSRLAGFRQLLGQGIVSDSCCGSLYCLTATVFI
jgi:hypothetical protein